MRVLVVDDEALARKVLSEMLKALGHQVVTASSGALAMQQYETSSEPFDLVLLDYAMPEMDGAAVYRALKNIAPAQRVVFVSAYDRQYLVERFSADSDTEFLRKPYSVEELRTAIAPPPRSPH